MNCAYVNIRSIKKDNILTYNQTHLHTHTQSNRGHKNMTQMVFLNLIPGFEYGAQ